MHLSGRKATGWGALRVGRVGSHTSHAAGPRRRGHRGPEQRLRRTGPRGRRSTSGDGGARTGYKAEKRLAVEEGEWEAGELLTRQRRHHPIQAIHQSEVDPPSGTQEAPTFSPRRPDRGQTTARDGTHVPRAEWRSHAPHDRAGIRHRTRKLAANSQRGPARGQSGGHSLLPASIGRQVDDAFNKTGIRRKPTYGA